MSRIPYLFIVPAIMAVFGIGFLPIANSIYLSLTSFSVLSPEPKFVGIQNYVTLFRDPFFYNAVVVTTIWVVGTVVTELVVGLFLALLMFGEVRGKRVFENILLAPLAISPIIMGILFSPNIVLDDINTFLFYGINSGLFIDVNQPVVYYGMMILADAFVWAPLFMLVMLAIMQNIPKENFEAADVYGASSFQTFKKLTFPAITHSPVLAVILALRVIDSFKAYEVPFTWSFWIGQERLGSPIDTFSVFMFKLFFLRSDLPLSYIATIAIVLLVISVSVAVLIMRLSTKSWEGS